jgi:hypothetical protein
MREVQSLTDKELVRDLKNQKVVIAKTLSQGRHRTLVQDDPFLHDQDGITGLL